MCGAMTLLLFIRLVKRAHRIASKCKGKIHPRIGHEGPEGRQRYSATLSLTSAVNVGGWSTLHLGRFTPGKETWHPFCRRLGEP
jgi:hypothetical protein